MSTNQILTTATAGVGGITKGYIVQVTARDTNGTPSCIIATDGTIATGQSLLGIAAESCAVGALFSVVVSGIVDYAVMGVALALQLDTNSGNALTTGAAGKLRVATLGNDQVVCKLINISNTAADLAECTVVMGG